MDPNKINIPGSVMFNTPIYNGNNVTYQGLTTDKKHFKRMTNPIDWNGILSKGFGVLGGVADIANTTQQLAGIDHSAINTINNEIDSDIANQYVANNLYGLANEANARADFDDVDAYDVGRKNAGQVAGGIGKGMLSGAKAGMAFGPWGALIGAAAGGLSTGAGAIANAVNSNKAAKRLNAQINSADNINVTKLNNQMNNIGQLDYQNILANYAAYGGLLDDTFNNGVTIFNVGGTHESNPYGGIPQGMDRNGKPNFVEEGEVKYKDYIYSNRLKVSKKLLEENQLPIKYANKTYAEVANILQQESKERPNDPISKNGLFITMSRLAKAQETLKQEQQKDNNKFAMGGNIDDDKKLLKQGNVTDTLGFLTDGMYRDPIHGQVKYKTYHPNLNDSIPLDVSSFKNNPIDVSRIIPNNLTKPMQPLNYDSNSLQLLEQMVLNQQPDSIENLKKDVPLASKIKNRKLDRNVNQKSKREININGYDNLPDDLLRYAGILGSGVWSDLIGLTNKPSYENINAMDRYANSIPDVSSESIGISQQYNPTDYRPILNELSSQAAAARRAVRNNNSPASNAQQLALNYNYNTGVGNLMQQYQQQELAKQNGINAFNANIENQDVANRANVAARNQAAAETRAKMHSDNAALREQIAAQAEASRAANMNTLLEDFSNMGYEGTANDLVSWLANTGAFGPGIGNYKFIKPTKK